MFNKLYDAIKTLIKENYKFIIFLVVIVALFTVKLPFYIECPGGVLNVNDKVEVEKSYDVSGSFNLAYVTSFKASLPTYIYASFNKDWDIYKKEDILDHNTKEEVDYRNHILLDEANANATIVAFNKTNNYVMVTNRKLIVIYIDENSNTDLQIGDEIKEVNGIQITDKNQLLDLIKNIDGKIEFKVLNNGEHERYAYKVDINGEKLVGIILSEAKDVDTSLDVKFKFKDTESGPSGGFMMALSLYNYLTEEDITKGMKIVGTGTIDEEGNVGAIGGIKYKIKGAAKEKADIFFVPVDNYDEAMKVVKDSKLKINVIKIEHIDEAIDYLKNYTK